MKPIRIQRKRTKGWRMPENTVYVGRPTMWSNPFVVGEKDLVGFGVVCKDREMAVNHFRNLVTARKDFDKASYKRIIQELEGKNLACWCPLDQPCHADILLEIANK